MLDDKETRIAVAAAPQTVQFDSGPVAGTQPLPATPVLFTEAVEALEVALQSLFPAVPVYRVCSSTDGGGAGGGAGAGAGASAVEAASTIGVGDTVQVHCKSLEAVWITWEAADSELGEAIVTAVGKQLQPQPPRSARSKRPRSDDGPPPEAQQPAHKRPSSGRS